MKLKFLSLFLALGIFAMGTSVMAKENVKQTELAGVKQTELAGGICPASDDNGYIQKWDLALNRGVCGILTLDSDLQTACKELCDDASKMSNAVPAKANVVKCAEALAAAGKKNSKIATAVNATVRAGCYVLCSGKKFGVGCNSCQYKNTKELCGAICCNFGDDAQSDLGACLTYQNEKCDMYK